MKNYLKTGALFVFIFGFLPAAFAETTNSIAAPVAVPSLPDNGLSVLRVFGALALVIGVFFGGVWMFKNWQRFAVQRGRAPKLNVLETRSLGGRHSIFVVGYEQERFLIASSPGGVNLLSHLPAATAESEASGPAAGADKVSQAPTFAQALAKMLKGK
jgi:flagellar biogenesis protein FliO